MGSSLKDKNLLLWEQILFFKRRLQMRRETQMKMKELMALKVNLKVNGYTAMFQANFTGETTITE